MVLKILTGFLLKPVFMGIASICLAAGAFTISEQSTSVYSQFVLLEGREAVMFGASLLFVGAAFVVFYLASWLFTGPLALVGALLVVVGFGLSTLESAVSAETIDAYLLTPLTSIVDTYATPLIDSTIRPLLDVMDGLL